MTRLALVWWASKAPVMWLKGKSARRIPRRAGIAFAARYQIGGAAPKKKPDAIASGWW